MLINGTQKVGIEKSRSAKAFTDYLHIIKDVHKKL